MANLQELLDRGLTPLGSGRLSARDALALLTYGFERKCVVTNVDATDWSDGREEYSPLGVRFERFPCNDYERLLQQNFAVARTALAKPEAADPFVFFELWFINKIEHW